MSLLRPMDEIGTAPPSGDPPDWKRMLDTTSRRSVVINGIAKKLSFHFPSVDFSDLYKTARGFEERIYNRTSIMTDYIQMFPFKLAGVEIEAGAAAAPFELAGAEIGAAAPAPSTQQDAIASGSAAAVPAGVEIAAGAVAVPAPSTQQDAQQSRRSAVQQKFELMKDCYFQVLKALKESGEIDLHLYIALQSDSRQCEKVKKLREMVKQSRAIELHLNRAHQSAAHQQRKVKKLRGMKESLRFLLDFLQMDRSRIDYGVVEQKCNTCENQIMMLLNWVLNSEKDKDAASMFEEQRRQQQQVLEFEQQQLQNAVDDSGSILTGTPPVVNLSTSNAAAAMTGLEMEQQQLDENAVTAVSASTSTETPVQR